MHGSENVKIAEVGCPEILKASFSEALCYNYEDTTQFDSMTVAWMGVQYRSSFAALDIFALLGCYAA
jgi:hypothetical protein